MQNAILQWAYRNKKAGNKASDVLKSIEEAEKTLKMVNIKKK